MLESDLRQKFKDIFGIENIKYSLPGESQEQECLFVNVESIKTRFKDGFTNSMVQGSVTYYANSDKIQLGYFAKRVALASNELTKNFFFGDFESNSKTYGNIVERSFTFTYFFNSQFDPKIGTITSLDQDSTYQE